MKDILIANQTLLGSKLPVFDDYTAKNLQLKTWRLTGIK